MVAAIVPPFRQRQFSGKTGAFQGGGGRDRVSTELFAAAKSLGLRTVMMNESHAGTEQATGSAYALRVYGVTRRWIKRQIVKQFDAALVGGEPHKRHFASLGIPADKIFTGYDAVDNALFAAKADEVRSMEHGARSVEREERAEKSFGLGPSYKASAQCSARGDGGGSAHAKCATAAEWGAGARWSSRWSNSNSTGQGFTSTGRGAWSQAGEREV